MGRSRAAGSKSVRYPGIAHDAEHERLLFTDATAFTGGLHAIDLSSGARSMFVAPGTDVGPNLRGGTTVLIDASTTAARALVLANQGVIAVDLGTSALSAVSSSDLGVGSGPGLYGPDDGAIDSLTGNVLVTAYTQVMSVSLADGRRELIADGDDVASGPRLRPGEITVDSEARIAYVGDGVRHCVMALDLVSTQRVSSRAESLLTHRASCTTGWACVARASGGSGASTAHHAPDRAARMRR